MFVRLTKKDGAPIWFNASYIVTVEPMRSGGATVVPIGDGLDYEVRERADDIISLVERAQGIVSAPAPVTPDVPAVVESAKPAKAVKATEKSVDGEDAQEEPPKFEDPNADAPQMSEAEAANAVAVVTAIKKGTLRRAPAKKTTRKTAKAGKADAKAAEPPVEAATPAPDAEPPVAEPAPAPEDGSFDVFASNAVRRTVDKVPVDLSTDQIDRLRAMAPKTVKKLLNSINAQFPVADPNATIQALKDHGIITVDEKGHVRWDALTLEDVLS